MIKSFRHKGVEKFFFKGSKADIQAHHAKKLNRQLSRLDAAISADDMNIPGWRFHALKGDMLNFYTVRVDANWRLTFTFEGSNAILVDYQDYH